MDHMQIIKKVAVKQILTEASKQKMLEKFKSQIQQLRKECEQLRFEVRRYERERKYDKGMMRKKFEEEIESRQERCKVLDYQIDQLEILPLGSELNDGEVETIFDLDVGDDWDEIMNQSAIIVKDGEVHSIR